MNIKNWTGILFALGLCLISCSGNRESNSREDSQSLDATGDVIEVVPRETEVEHEGFVNWSSDDGVMLLICGYGFNEDEFYKKTESVMAQKFGLSSNGGLVKCLRFPEDFHGRISNLNSMVNEENVRGIIILGAPEGTHFALAKIREDREKIRDFNIFSFFPQDDILGQEATSNFVLDHETSGAIKLEEQEQVVDKDIFELITSAVAYSALLPFSLPSDGELHAHVQLIAGRRKVHRYVDGETGIQVRNHFVIESPE